MWREVSWSLLIREFFDDECEEFLKCRMIFVVLLSIPYICAPYE